MIVVYIVQDITLAWELTQARELVKKRAIEKTGFIETCKKINANLLTIFRQHKSNPKFSFWLIDKHRQRDMKQAKAIIHNHTLDSAEEIEKELQKTYSMSTSE